MEKIINIRLHVGHKFEWTNRAKALWMDTGLVNYSAAEIARIKGLKTSVVEQALGYKDYDEVIHRDNMVVTKKHCKLK